MILGSRLLTFQKAIALVALIGMVAAIASERVKRWVAALVAALIVVSLGVIHPVIALSYVDFDLLGLIVGIGILSYHLKRSNVVEWLSIKLVMKFKGDIKPIFFFICLIAGIVSIALENVSVVLLIAPIIYSLGRRLGFNPVTLLIAMALSSNIAGSATMIGDPPAIITASEYGLAFMDFIFYEGRPSMFFITVIPMLIAISLTTAIYARSAITKPVSDLSKEVRLDKVYVTEVLVFLAIKIALLSLRNVLHIPLSLSAAVGAGGLIITRLAHKDLEGIKEGVKEGFDWELLLFLVGVFIVSGAFNESGLARDFAYSIMSLGNNAFLITSALIWISVALSAFIDNVPYVATMIPVINVISDATGIGRITLAWALLTGATLGGNITYIGASANATAIRLAEKWGYRVRFIDFIKIGLVFTMSSILSGWALYIMFWLL